MSQARRAFGIATVVIIGMGAAACGESDSPGQASGSPTSPSALAVSTPTTAPAPTAMPTASPDPLGDPIAVFVQSGDEWSYLDDGSDQGVAWRQTTFADAAWPRGNAQLGYGDNDESTVVSFGPDPNQKFITTYFRKSFTVNDASSHAAVALDMIVDDGAVIYVNGVEVFRTNMPGGAVSSTTRAAGSIQNSNVVISTSIPQSILVNGTNVIAVEVHQVAPDSSDLTFNLALRDPDRAPQPGF